MASPAVTAYQVHGAVLAYLRAGFTAYPQDVYDGAVVNPRTIGTTGKVQPYLLVVFAPNITGAFGGSDVALDGPVPGDHRVHVTAAGATPQAAYWAADKATTLLSRAVIDVTGAGPVETRWLDGYVPGPALQDHDVTPPRWFVPLIFTTHPL